MVYKPEKPKKPAKFTMNGSLLVDSNPQSRIAEQYRTIRNNIRYAFTGSRLKTLAITSPSEGEGKTTAAVNLAVCMAHRGDRVLLIDANLRKPILHYLFRFNLTPGLIDMLSDSTGQTQAIRQTDVDGLFVLSSGTGLYNAAELLDSPSMSKLLELAAEQYDTVVLDCSSVLVTPDANALAGKCDGVLLVLKSEKTNQHLAVEAKRALELGNAKILGAILNKKSGKQ